MIVSMVTEDAMLRRRNLDVAWIDYKKAFDHVPHGWLREMLELCGVPMHVQHCLRELQTKWCTVFTLRHAGGLLETDQIQYKRGLFQGDALPPLLFCLSVTPLSYGLRTTAGYSPRFTENPVTHLMFVDDLKVYAAGAKPLEQSMKAVERVTNAIGMRIGVQKCATACLRRGKVTESAGYNLTDGDIRALAEGKSYKYLGIQQVIRSEPDTVRRALKAAYKHRLQQIWRAGMSGRNKVHATNIWAVSLFRYYFCSPLKWSKTYLKELDRNTRAILRKRRGHYRGSAVERLYLKGDCGGRGLQSLTHVYQKETVAAAAYLVAPHPPIRCETPAMDGGEAPALFAL